MAIRSAWVFLITLPGWGQSWMQWGMNAQHTGAVGVKGQPPQRLLASLPFDPFTEAEQAESGGDLLTHYQAPLTDGRNVFMAFKSGRYVSCTPPGSGRPVPCGPTAWNEQTWSVKHLRWRGTQLKERWTFESDWKPVPDGGFLGGWEPVFHAALSAGRVFVPASGGDVFVVRRGKGTVVKRIRPFAGDPDPNKYVSGPLTLDDAGNLYYNVLELDANDPWGAQGTDIPGAWLVKVARDGTVSTLSYTNLIPDAPSQCRTTFRATDLPWPPSPSATPPAVPCLSQRPGVNIPLAIAPDGTIYSVTRAHSPAGGRYAYVVALNPDLTLKWAASLRDRLKDGCGAGLPVGGPGGCRAGTPSTGVDPATNEAPAGIVTDLSSSSPVVAPDGSVLYGAYSRYNYARGHLFHFSADGQFLNAYDFGWDTTPAIYEHGGTYSVVLKENSYAVGSYCGDSSVCPAKENGPYYITQLNASLQPEWRFQNTNTQACSRQADGTLQCVDAEPGGFEWCINAPAVDALGNVYANSEDGNLYVIAQGGTLTGQLFLNLAIGAAYTPLSIGYDGRIYTENDGKLFVVGR
jgi:hypothetical protein